MLSFLHAFPGQHAFALFMNLQHVDLCLLAGPAKYFLKNVRDVIHKIDRVIPANYQIPRFKIGFPFFLDGLDDARLCGRCCSVSHAAKIEEVWRIVERGGACLEGRLEFGLKARYAFVMSTAEKIFQAAQNLPEEAQDKLLHVAEELSRKCATNSKHLTLQETAELRGKLAAWEDDWNAPGMEAYDRC